jgi:hypothetical protein
MGKKCISEVNSAKAGALPGVKYWYGATPSEAMRHHAVKETLSGKAADWLERVTDDPYPSAAH